MSSRLLDSQSHPSKKRAAAILHALWPDEESGTPWYVNWRMNEVLDVIAGLPVPTLSYTDRKKIEEKMKEIE